MTRMSSNSDQPRIVLFIFILSTVLLLSTVTAIRSIPNRDANASVKSEVLSAAPGAIEQSLAGEKIDGKEAAIEDDLDLDCHGIDEEECLIRRTLAAHVDYIYTQHDNP
eukprot:Gb_26508 [translate_table: standard]